MSSTFGRLFRITTFGESHGTANYASEILKLEAGGRHDPCVVPRAVPIVEAMAALVLADLALIQRSRG
jgi:chorismate synthase